MRFLAQISERNPVATGMIGMGSSLSASAITFLVQLDLIIRIAGGVVALLIGLISLYGLVRSKWFRRAQAQRYRN